MSMALLETTWSYVDNCVVYYVKHDNIYLHMKSYMYSSNHFALSDQLDYDFVIMHIMLGLSLGYFDLTMWVYVDYIDDFMIVIEWI